MANYFPATYPQVYPQTYPQSLQTYPQYQQNYSPSNYVNWVQGEAEAKSYPIAPNNTILLMDGESQKFYLKSADGTGRPTLKTFAYKEVVNEPVIGESNSEGKVIEYATKQELGVILEQIQALQKQLEEMTQKEVEVTNE